MTGHEVLLQEIQRRRDMGSRLQAGATRDRWWGEADALQEVADEQKADLAMLVEETGSASVDDLRDMALVGHSLIESIASLNRCPGPFKNWAPSNDPAEIVTDLFNALHDMTLERDALSARLADPAQPAAGDGGLRDAAADYFAALDSDPENDCWATETGEPEEGAERFPSDWAWRAHEERVNKARDALRACLITPPAQEPTR